MPWTCKNCGTDNSTYQPLCFNTGCRLEKSTWSVVPEQERVIRLPTNH